MSVVSPLMESDMRAAVRHVYWLGDASTGGKNTITMPDGAARGPGLESGHILVGCRLAHSCVVRWQKNTHDKERG